MNKSQRMADAALRSPILWGAVAGIVFYALLHGGVLGKTFLHRYCAGHPVAYIETAMFFVALASLVLKGVDVLTQSLALEHSLLASGPQDGSPAEAAQEALDHLDHLPARRAREYYARRLHAAMEHVVARGSVDALDDELKYLADADAGRVHASYGLFSLVIWAIPILGFLGTVIGITMALNGVDLQAPDQSMARVLTGLGLKFDTTALALTLAMLLMFAHFRVSRSEMALMERIDQQVARELAGFFPRVPAGPDGQAAAMRRMADTMIHATERLVKRQAELWQHSMEAAQGRWSSLAEDAGAQLGTALAESLKLHAREVAAAEQTAADRNRQQWSELQRVLSENVQAVAAAQEALVRRVEVLHQAAEATAQVTRLEEALNRNLASLAGAKNFEETVMSLAAAIHLLTARLTETPASPKVRLESPRRVNQAA